jgi:hypothetical protein
MIRHSREAEIVDIALNNLSQSELGMVMVDFIRDNNVIITVLRGSDNRDYAPDKDHIFISVSEGSDVDDPAHTINLAGAIREAGQEYEPHLKRLTIDHGESIHFHREEKKFEDKIIWQTAIVYELGKIANRSEFIDSFTLMGYSYLVDAYEKDINEKLTIITYND